MGCWGYSQVNSYSFLQSTTTYTEISGGVALGNESSDDQRFVTPLTPLGATTVTGIGLPIGFNFNFNGVVYDSFAVNTNGWISLGTSATTPSVNNDSSGPYAPLSSTVTVPDNLVSRISALAKDLQAQVGASLRYETVGTAPNRTLVVQWKNYKKYGTNGDGDSFSFQIRLNETSNTVSIVYGNMVSNASTDQLFQVGLRGGPATPATNFLSRTSQTSWSATTQSVAVGDSILMNATIFPASGLTYTWSPPTCGAPSGLVTSAILTDSATLTWQPSVPVPVGYEYVVSTTNTIPTAAGTAVTGTTANVTSLAANTLYYVFLRSNCGTEFSNWLSVGNFRTACGVVATFSENFDALTTGTTVLPSCWAAAGTGSAYVTTGGVAPGSTPNRFYMFASATTPTVAYALLPTVSNLQANTHRLRFKAYATTAGKTLDVGYFTDVTNASSFVLVQSVDLPSTAATTAVEFFVRPAALPAGVTRLVLRNAPTGTGTSTVYIDDVLWQAVPSCEAPLNLAVPTITATEATVTWTAVTGSVGYEYIVNTVAADPTVAGTTVSTPTFTTTTPLTPATVYYAHVRNNCGTEFSAWSTVTFTTRPAPPVNDFCTGAITLAVNPDVSCTLKTTGTLVAATPSGEPYSSTVGTPDDDVWFKFVATSTRHRIAITNVAGTPTDLVHEVSEGSCGGQLFSLLVSDPDTSTLSGLIIGDTYYVRVFTKAVGGGTTTFSICVGVPPGIPANDNCSGAVALTVNADLACGVKTVGTLESATDSGVVTTLPLTPVGTPNDDVWYSFVATGTAHTIALSGVTGTPTDLVNEIFVGTCAGLVSLRASDPDTNAVTGLTIGTTYYVRVYSYAAATGATTSFSICVGTAVPAAVPVNNEVAGAIALTINAVGTCTTTRTGSTVSATQSAETAPTCNATGINDDVWYTFVATDANIKFTFTAATNTMAATLYTGTPGSLVQVAGTCLSGNNINFTALTVGTTYYARVYTDSSNPTLTNTFTLCAAVAPVAPVNDNCAGAVLLTPSATSTCATQTSGTTLGATQSLVGCAGTADDDVWYKFVATSANHTILITNVTGSPTSDIVTQVFDSCGGTSMVCQDTPNSPIDLAGLTIGNTYVFRIYSWSSAAASTTNFTVCVATPAPPAPAPANDACSGAIALVPGTVFANGVVTGTTESATTTTGLVPTCTTSGNSEVWYSVVVPPSGTITVETQSAPGSSLTDTVLSIYSGTCTALVSVGCDDDGSDDGNFSKLSLTAQTPGATLYVAVFRYGTANTGQFRVSAYDASLSAPSFDDASFKAYPNPVKDVLNLSYNQEISNVAIFNLVGQQVVSKTVGSNDAQVDMSHLAQGTYLVKVTVDNQVKTIKVLKN